jgi:hypothetical protein
MTRDTQTSQDRVNMAHLHSSSVPAPLRWVVAIVAAGFLSFGIALACEFVLPTLLVGVRAFLVSAMLVLAAGLFRLRSWARLLTVVVLWLLVYRSACGQFNPFLANDRLLNGEVNDDICHNALVVVCSCSALVFVLHILGRYKAHFKSGAF